VGDLDRPVVLLVLVLMLVPLLVVVVMLAPVLAVVRATENSLATETSVTATPGDILPSRIRTRMACCTASTSEGTSSTDTLTSFAYVRPS